MDESKVIERLHQLKPLTDEQIRALYDAAPSPSTCALAWELRRMQLVLALTKHALAYVHPTGWEKPLIEGAKVRLENEPGVAKYQSRPLERVDEPTRRARAPRPNASATDESWPPPVPEFGMWPWLK